jgi:hypothetical protein
MKILNKNYNFTRIMRLIVYQVFEINLILVNKIIYFILFLALRYEINNDSTIKDNISYIKEFDSCLASFLDALLNVFYFLLIQ